MKLKCNKCGDIIESGIANVIKHQFEDCKAIYTEPIPDCDWATARIMPFVTFTIIEENKTI